MPETLKQNDLPLSVIEQAQALIRQYRDQCLWFMREDCLPDDRDGLLRAIRHIEQSGTRDAYVQARSIEKWLLRDSNETSADS